MSGALPGTDEGWLSEIARAYRDAAEAKWFGLLTKGRPIRDSEYFHLAARGGSRLAAIRSGDDRSWPYVVGPVLRAGQSLPHRAQRR